ncbi:glycosyltransferase family 4 protein [Rhodomicrobium sp.]|uniref:glycosyltransferase family 4 protein n=1 Tax=Rhodomicrobium sp. TaxID=2720632 RepID=UPI0039E489BF
MRILLATDAWKPQINGVVNTYLNLEREAAAEGFDLSFLTPEGFRTLPLPTYDEIRLALIRPSDVAERVDYARPDFIHIATEGPIGLAARAYCLKAGRPFTTSYHTRFPEYVAARAPVPVSWGYGFERWFHNSGVGVMAASLSLCQELADHGIRRVHLWSRGVDLDLFRPRSVDRFPELPRPIFLYAGRVAVEKNLDAFLDLDLPGTKVIVGKGPQLEELRNRYPDAVFTGAKFGDDLAEHYASADAFVFPSLTDTFGNVLLEAMACGVPTAAFNVTGPKDVVENGRVGIIGDDLREAALGALKLDRSACRAYAERFSWAACARRFRDIIVEANRGSSDRRDG